MKKAIDCWKHKHSPSSSLQLVLDSSSPLPSTENVFTGTYVRFYVNRGRK